MFGKDIFLFVCEGSFIDVEKHEVDGIIFVGVVDDVFVIGAMALHVLSFLEVLYCSDLVTELYGLFELVVLGCIVHLFFKLFEEFWCVATKNEFGLDDTLVVVCFGDVSDAWCVAELDMISKAGPFWESFAGAYMEGFSNEAEEVVAFLCGDEGTIEFTGTGVLSGKEYPGVGFVEYLYIGESFGIFEVDVVFGLVSFNEGAFKDDCFKFGVGCDGFYGGCLCEH